MYKYDLVVVTNETKVAKVISVQMVICIHCIVLTTISLEFTLDCISYEEDWLKLLREKLVIPKGQLMIFF